MNYRIVDDLNQMNLSDIIRLLKSSYWADKRSDEQSDLALSIAISAFTDFLMDHDMTVYLVLFNGKAFSLASSLFSDLRSYIDDNYVEKQMQKEYGSPYERRRQRENLAPPEEYEVYED